MTTVNRLMDNAYAMRILRTLAMDFKDMPAYHLGIIDAKGNVLRKSYQLKSEAERNAYTYLDRLIIILKKEIEKIRHRGDFGITKTLSPALWTVREALESKSRSTAGIAERFNDVISKDVTLVEEEILVRKYIAEEGEGAAVGGTSGAMPVGGGGAPTNNISGASVKEPVVKKKDIKKYQGTVVRRPAIKLNGMK